MLKMICEPSRRTVGSRDFRLSSLRACASSTQQMLMPSMDRTECGLVCNPRNRNDEPVAGQVIVVRPTSNAHSRPNCVIVYSSNDSTESAMLFWNCLAHKTSSFSRLALASRYAAITQDLPDPRPPCRTMRRLVGPSANSGANISGYW